MKLTVGLVLVCVGIINVFGENPIECGQTQEEFIGKSEKKIYTFNSDLDYSSIDINACTSEVENAQIQYDLGDGNWLIADECPGDSTKKGYKNIENIVTGQNIKIQIGSSRKRKTGDSFVKLICNGGQSAPPTPDTISPTLQPSDITNAPSYNPTTSLPTLQPTTSPITSIPTDIPTTPLPTTPVPTTPSPITPSPTTPQPTTTTTTTTTTDSDNSNCGRHRKPWHLLTKSERLLYINGFKTLHKNKKLAQFNHVHRYNAMHGKAGFLPWHRYFLYELESQIRALGGDYECFALPYFDWAFELSEANQIFENMIIFKSGLGNIGNGGCVNDGGISNNEYIDNNNHFNQDEYTADGVCLIRNACTGNNCYWTGSTVGDLMSKMDATNEYSAYRYSIESSGHNMCHMRVAGNSGSHIGSTWTACFDPIFWLLHCFVDYQWAVFQDCHEQEIYKNEQVTSNMYSGSDIFTEMDFGILANGGNGGISGSIPIQNWETLPYVYSNQVRPCDVNSWIEGLLSDVTYETGAFFEVSGGVLSDTDECSDKMNINVFRNTGLFAADRRRRRRRLQENSDYDTEYSRFSSNSYDALNERVGGSKRNKEQKTSVYKAWSRLECEYLTMENPCVRPKYFDDCSYMEIKLRDRGYQKYQDIEITKEELLEKVGNIQCMIDTIETMYDWSYQTGNLLGLCKGDYYPFCDRDSLDQENNDENEQEDQCKARENRRKSKYANSYSSPSNINKFNQIEQILISAMINGLIISIILLMIYCCYKMKYSVILTSKTRHYKYDAVDAEYQ